MLSPALPLLSVHHAVYYNKPVQDYGVLSDNPGSAPLPFPIMELLLPNPVCHNRDCPMHMLPFLTGIPALHIVRLRYLPAY